MEKPFGFVTDQGNIVDITPTRLIQPRGLAIGLSAGFKAEFWFLELGRFQDEAIVGARVHYTLFASPGNGSYIMSNLPYFHGGSYSRTSLNYGFKFTGERDRSVLRKTRWELWGLVGLDYWRRPPIPAKSPIGFLWSFNAQDVMSLDVDMQTPLRSNYYGTLGLMLKAFNGKGHSILNFSMFYSQGLTRRVMAQSFLTFTNYTDGKFYQRVINSKGSGFYFQVSKDIYLNNIIRRKENRLPK